MHRQQSLSCRGNGRLPSYQTGRESRLSQLWRGLAAFGCPLRFRSKILGVTEQCADAPPVEQCNGRRDRLHPSGIVRGVLNRDLWLAIVSQPVRDGQLREGLREVARYS
jgi:hypothetical protein